MIWYNRHYGEAEALLEFRRGGYYIKRRIKRLIGLKIGSWFFIGYMQMTNAPAVPTDKDQG